MSAMTAAPPSPPVSPAPTRLRTPRWMDLRLATGVLLVLVAVLVGAKVVRDREPQLERTASLPFTIQL